MLNQKLVEIYRKCRKHKPFMLVGRDAEYSLRAAKTILEFRELESQKLVRMRAEPEEENYFDFFGRQAGERNGHPVSEAEETKRMVEILDRLGVWWTVAEWFDGEDWQQADSCGMHTGYVNPLDPFENCYVVDEMRSAIEALREHQEQAKSDFLPCPMI